VLFNLLGMHWPDREADAAVGKRSLVVVAGDRVRPLHHGLVAAAYLLTLAFSGWVLPLPVTLALLGVLPLNLWATLTFARHRSTVPSALAMAGSLAAAAGGWIVAAA